MAGRPSSPRETVYLVIAVAVTVVWSVATLAQVVWPERTVPTYANLIMAAVAASFFGGAVVSKRRSDAGGDE